MPETVSAQDGGGGASRSTDPASGTSSATDVSLREYFNEKISGDRKTNRDRFVFVAALGGVIWFFIERHLADLNHENARVAAVTEKSVSSDTYEANEQQRKSESDKLEGWRHDVDRDRTQSVSRTEFQTEGNISKRGTIDTTTKIVGAVVAACVLGLALLNYQALHRTSVPASPQVVTVTTSTP